MWLRKCPLLLHIVDQCAEWIGIIYPRGLLIWDICWLSNSVKCYVETWLIPARRRVRHFQSDDSTWSYLVSDKCCVHNHCYIWLLILSAECEWSALALWSVCVSVLADHPRRCVIVECVCGYVRVYFSPFSLYQSVSVSMCACGCRGGGWWAQWEPGSWGNSSR